MTPIYGLILAGGESTRMGADKSLITFHHTPQREHLTALLGKFCSKTFISCKKLDQVPAHLNPLPDKYEMRSPMNGILSALTTNPSVAWLSLPVDMPFIDDKTIRYLVNNRDDKSVATCFYDSDGTLPEPLFTIWEPAAFPLMKKFFEEGKTRPREFLTVFPVRILKSPYPQMHLNINSPEDLKKFRDSQGYSP